MMEYKGYIGKVEFDSDAGLIHGEVINTRDVITFQGHSVAEVKNAFHESVDDYLAFYKSRGESPDKPFSGQFMTRIPPELHRQVNLAAMRSGKSLNAWVVEQLQGAVANSEVAKLAVTEKLPAKASKRKDKVVARKTITQKRKKNQQHA